MFDFETNAYSATAQLLSDAIERSKSHDETVGIRARGPRLESVREALLEECEGHDDDGLFWGEGWRIRLIPR
jgi:hypothetical protein